jgi:hypothetical protein
MCVFARCSAPQPVACYPSCTRARRASVFNTETPQKHAPPRPFTKKRSGKRGVCVRESLGVVFAVVVGGAAVQLHRAPTFCVCFSLLWRACATSSFFFLLAGTFHQLISVLCLPSPLPFITTISLYCFIRHSCVSGWIPCGSRLSRAVLRRRRCSRRHERGTRALDSVLSSKRVSLFC